MSTRQYRPKPARRGWRRSAGQLIALCALALAPVPAISACPDADFESRVEGREHCLLMQRYGAAHPRTLVVWLHGDLPGGGAADYHAALARATAEHFAQRKVMAIALLRPGYPDSRGEVSGGSHLGRSDHYTLANIDELAGAIERLRARFNPASLVVVGHAGGAASAAILLGRHPRLVDAAVLVSCPCDLVLWRIGRRYWGRSENPILWTPRVPREARVIALTGGRDFNTRAELAQSYVDTLRARGVEAHFRMLPQADHEAAARSPEVQDAIGLLIER